MMRAENLNITGLPCAKLASACLIFLVSFPAKAAAQAGQARQVLRETYELQSAAQPVARFDVAEENNAFILDQRVRGQMLFRFESAREVFVLHRVPGPRGDTMLKNDLGAVMVRMSRVGGPVLFSDTGSPGVPAWRSGPAAPLGPQSVRLEDLTPALTEIANDLAANLEHNVFVTVADVDAQSAWLYLDAALNARSAIMRLIRTPDRKGRVLPPLSEIRISSAQEQKLALQDTILEINIVVDQGFAGRPSSLRLAGFLSGKSTRPDKHAEKLPR